MKTVCYISSKFTEKDQSGEDVLFVDKFSISVSKAKTRKKKKHPEIINSQGDKALDINNRKISPLTFSVSSLNTKIQKEAVFLF